MELRIFSRNAILTDVYDGALSVSAEEKLTDAGAFSAVVPIADASRFPVEGIVQIPQFGAFVIETVEKDAATMTATVGGRGVLSYFARRALPDMRLYEGAAAAILTSLAEEGAATLGAPLLLTPSAGGREIGTAVGRGSLLSAMRSVCDAGHVGMSLSLSADGFVFSVREIGDSADVLARGEAHLTGGSRILSLENYVNRVIVAASGGYRVIVDAAGRFADGFDDAASPLREKYVYVSGITSDMYATEASFTEALTTEGVRTLARHRPVQSVSLSVTDTAASRLRIGTRYGIDDNVLSLRCRALCTAKRIRARGEESEYGADLTLIL